MAVQDPERRARLLAMIKADEDVRSELAADALLFGGYHPRMEAVHLENARALEEMLRTAWPKADEVGCEAQEAAWLIAQHAISWPDFQRRCLGLLRTAVACGDAPARHLATLEDRVRVSEGRPQVYGTQFDWDADGTMSPLPIEDASNVDRRRATVGLEPLSQAAVRLHEATRVDGGRPPENHEEYMARKREWLRRVGWQ